MSFKRQNKCKYAISSYMAVVYIHTILLEETPI
jgi:hypothetical protein